MTSSTIGPFYPTAVAQSNLAGPANTWSNPNNALGAPDTVNATVGVGVSNAAAKYLAFTGFDIAIPPGSIVTGIEAFVRCIGSGSVVLARIELVKGGVVTGTNHSSGSDSIPVSLIDTNYGGLGDYWGSDHTVWRASDIGHNPSFGINMLFQHVSGSGSVGLDAVGISISINTPTQSEATRGLMGILRSARNFFASGL